MSYSSCFEKVRMKHEIRRVKASIEIEDLNIFIIRDYLWILFDNFALILCLFMKGKINEIIIVHKVKIFFQNQTVIFSI